MDATTIEKGTRENFDLFINSEMNANDLGTLDTFGQVLEQEIHKLDGIQVDSHVANSAEKHGNAVSSPGALLRHDVDEEVLLAYLQQVNKKKASSKSTTDECEMESKHKNKTNPYYGDLNPFCPHKGVHHYGSHKCSHNHSTRRSNSRGVSPGMPHSRSNQSTGNPGRRLRGGSRGPPPLKVTSDVKKETQEELHRKNIDSLIMKNYVKKMLDKLRDGIRDQERKKYEEQRVIDEENMKVVQKQQMDELERTYRDYNEQKVHCEKEIKFLMDKNVILQRNLKKSQAFIHQKIMHCEERDYLLDLHPFFAIWKDQTHYSQKDRLSQHASRLIYRDQKHRNLLSGKIYVKKLKMHALGAWKKLTWHHKLAHDQRRRSSLLLENMRRTHTSADEFFLKVLIGAWAQLTDQHKTLKKKNRNIIEEKLRLSTKAVTTWTEISNRNCLSYIMSKWHFQAHEARIHNHYFKRNWHATTMKIRYKFLCRVLTAWQLEAVLRKHRGLNFYKTQKHVGRKESFETSQFLSDILHNWKFLLLVRHQENEQMMAKKTDGALGKWRRKKTLEQCFQSWILVIAAEIERRDSLLNSSYIYGLKQRRAVLFYAWRSHCHKERQTEMLQNLKAEKMSLVSKCVIANFNEKSKALRANARATIFRTWKALTKSHIKAVKKLKETDIEIQASYFLIWSRLHVKSKKRYVQEMKKLSQTRHDHGALREVYDTWRLEIEKWKLKRLRMNHHGKNKEMDQILFMKHVIHLWTREVDHSNHAKEKKEMNHAIAVGQNQLRKTLDHAGVGILMERRRKNTINSIFLHWVYFWDKAKHHSHVCAKHSEKIINAVSRAIEQLEYKEHKLKPFAHWRNHIQSNKVQICLLRHHSDMRNHAVYQRYFWIWASWMKHEQMEKNKMIHREERVVIKWNHMVRHLVKDITDLITQSELARDFTTRLGALTQKLQKHKDKHASNLRAIEGWLADSRGPKDLLADVLGMWRQMTLQLKREKQYASLSTVEERFNHFRADRQKHAAYSGILNSKLDIFQKVWHSWLTAVDQGKKEKEVVFERAMKITSMSQWWSATADRDRKEEVFYGWKRQYLRVRKLNQLKVFALNSKCKKDMRNCFSTWYAAAFDIKGARMLQNHKQDHKFNISSQIHKTFAHQNRYLLLAVFRAWVFQYHKVQAAHGKVHHIVGQVDRLKERNSHLRNLKRMGYQGAWHELTAKDSGSNSYPETRPKKSLQNLERNHSERNSSSSNNGNNGRMSTRRGSDPSVNVFSSGRVSYNTNKNTSNHVANRSALMERRKRQSQTRSAPGSPAPPITGYTTSQSSKKSTASERKHHPASALWEEEDEHPSPAQEPRSLSAERRLSASPLHNSVDTPPPVSRLSQIRQSSGRKIGRVKHGSKTHKGGNKNPARDYSPNPREDYKRHSLLYDDEGRKVVDDYQNLLFYLDDKDKIISKSTNNKSKTTSESEKEQRPSDPFLYYGEPAEFSSTEDLDYYNVKGDYGHGAYNSSQDFYSTAPEAFAISYGPTLGTIDDLGDLQTADADGLQEKYLRDLHQLEELCDGAGASAWPSHQYDITITLFKRLFLSMAAVRAHKNACRVHLAEDRERRLFLRAGFNAFAKNRTREWPTQTVIIGEVRNVVAVRDSLCQTGPVEKDVEVVFMPPPPSSALSKTVTKCTDDYTDNNAFSRDKAHLKEIKIYLNYIGDELSHKLRVAAGVSGQAPQTSLVTAVNILTWLQGLVQKLRNPEKLGDVYGTAKYLVSDPLSLATNPEGRLSIKLQQASPILSGSRPASLFETDVRPNGGMDTLHRGTWDLALVGGASSGQPYHYYHTSSNSISNPNSNRRMNTSPSGSHVLSGSQGGSPRSKGGSPRSSMSSKGRKTTFQQDVETMMHKVAPDHSESITFPSYIPSSVGRYDLASSNGFSYTNYNTKVDKDLHSILKKSSLYSASANSSSTTIGPYHRPHDRETSASKTSNSFLTAGTWDRGALPAPTDRQSHAFGGSSIHAAANQAPVSADVLMASSSPKSSSSKSQSRGLPSSSPTDDHYSSPRSLHSSDLRKQRKKSKSPHSGGAGASPGGGISHHRMSPVEELRYAERKAKDDRKNEKKAENLRKIAMEEEQIIDNYIEKAKVKKVENALVRGIVHDTPSVADLCEDMRSVGSNDWSVLGAGFGVPGTGTSAADRFAHNSIGEYPQRFNLPRGTGNILEHHHRAVGSTSNYPTLRTSTNYPGLESMVGANRNSSTKSPPRQTLFGTTVGEATSSTSRPRTSDSKCAQLPTHSIAADIENTFRNETSASNLYHSPSGAMKRWEEKPMNSNVGNSSQVPGGAGLHPMHPSGSGPPKMGSGFNSTGASSPKAGNPSGGDGSGPPGTGPPSLNNPQWKNRSKDKVLHHQDTDLSEHFKKVVDEHPEDLHVSHHVAKHAHIMSGRQIAQIHRQDTRNMNSSSSSEAEGENGNKPSGKAAGALATASVGVGSFPLNGAQSIGVGTTASLQNMDGGSTITSTRNPTFPDPLTVGTNRIPHVSTWGPIAGRPDISNSKERVATRDEGTSSLPMSTLNGKNGNSNGSKSMPMAGRFYGENHTSSGNDTDSGAYNAGGIRVKKRPFKSNLAENFKAQLEAGKR